jgi:hypothetical protein
MSKRKFMVPVTLLSVKCFSAAIFPMKCGYFSGALRLKSRADSAIGPAYTLRTLTHFLSEAATRRYIFFADFEPPPTRKQEIGKKRADRLFFTSDRL